MKRMNEIEEHLLGVSLGYAADDEVLNLDVYDLITTKNDKTYIADFLYAIEQRFIDVVGSNKKLFKRLSLIGEEWDTKNELEILAMFCVCGYSNEKLRHQYGMDKMAGFYTPLIFNLMEQLAGELMENETNI